MKRKIIIIEIKCISTWKFLGITIPREIIKSSHICTDIQMAENVRTTKVKGHRHVHGDSEVTMFSSVTGFLKW